MVHVPDLVYMSCATSRGDYDGRRPLHIAAGCGSTEVINYIIDKHKANVNVVDRFGGTPLNDAVKHNHAAAALAIRSAGGELMLPDAGCILCTLVMEYVASNPTRTSSCHAFCCHAINFCPFSGCRGLTRLCMWLLQGELADIGRVP